MDPLIILVRVIAGVVIFFQVTRLLLALTFNESGGCGPVTFILGLVMAGVLGWGLGPRSLSLMVLGLWAVVEGFVQGMYRLNVVPLVKAYHETRLGAARALRDVAGEHTVVPVMGVAYVSVDGTPPSLTLFVDLRAHWPACAALDCAATATGWQVAVWQTRHPRRVLGRVRMMTYRHLVLTVQVGGVGYALPVLIGDGEMIEPTLLHVLLAADTVAIRVYDRALAKHFRDMYVVDGQQRRARHDAHIAPRPALHVDLPPFPVDALRGHLDDAPDPMLARVLDEPAGPTGVKASVYLTARTHDPVGYFVHLMQQGIAPSWRRHPQKRYRAAVFWGI